MVRCRVLVRRVKGMLRLQSLSILPSAIRPSFGACWDCNRVSHLPIQISDTVQVGRVEQRLHGTDERVKTGPGLAFAPLHQPQCICRQGVRLTTAMADARSLLRAAADASSRLEIDLYVAGLDAPSTNITALSYTWGESTCTSTVFINGVTHVIRQNLYRFLLQLLA